MHFHESSLVFLCAKRHLKKGKIMNYEEPEEYLELVKIMRRVSGCMIPSYYEDTATKIIIGLYESGYHIVRHGCDIEEMKKEFINETR